MGVATIEKAFPKLRKQGYKITSVDAVDYNCFAWVLNDTTRWWSPALDGCYWPDGFSAALTVANFVRLFKLVSGYEPCSHCRYERGFEKIAIYADNEGNVTHAARQTESGKWTSKLGDWEDIEHDTLEALEGDFYGKVRQFLKRVAPFR
jgi:hypothetical protein